MARSSARRIVLNRISPGRTPASRMAHPRRGKGWRSLRGLAPLFRRLASSIGDVAGWTPEGLSWLVWGSNGENLIRAEGRTRDEAWRNTELQARAVVLLAR